MNEDIYERNIRLIGEEKQQRLRQTTVLVVGLGGVGSYATEALARVGVGRLILLDGDKIAVSNLNRQLFALQSTLNTFKTDAAKKRIADINPNTEVIAKNVFLAPENIDEVLKDVRPDYVLDAIDTTRSKIALIKWCAARRIPEIVCAGTGNRLDPTAIKYTTLDKTQGDPLCRRLRAEAKKEGLILAAIRVIYSVEQPRKTTTMNNKEISSVVFAPAAAGITAAYYLIKDLTE